MYTLELPCSLLYIHGCSKQCATSIHHLLPADTLHYHGHFAGLSPFARKQWLLDYLVMNSSGTRDQETGCQIDQLSTFSAISIYQSMTEELQQRGKSTVISQSQFFDLWKTHFGHVTIPKVHCRLPPSPHPPPLTMQQ